MSDPSEETIERIRNVLDELGGVNVPHGDHYEFLRALILDELSIQLLAAEVAVAPQTVEDIAERIALEVDYVFTLSLRNLGTSS